jgi:RNA 2',3'-cyclic 3'-phosphodiesterase
LIRLFTALDVPGSLKNQIEQLPRKGLNSARFSHIDDLHITLRFMGEVEEEKLLAIQEILEGVRIKEFTVVVKGLALFEKKKQAVLYAPVESARAVTHLSAEVTERLQKIGFIFTEQFYKPHVTIARLKNTHGLQDYIMQHSKKIFAEWKDQRFILYRSSEPDGKGQRYTKLREYALVKY